jgi:addiction module RelE/StbE family toxin
MRIDWTEPALKDIEDINDFVSRDSEYYARKLIGNIFDSVEKLADFPRIGHKVFEIEEDEVREIFCHPYRIFYRVEKDCILILSIIHGAREIKTKQ